MADRRIIGRVPTQQPGRTEGSSVAQPVTLQSASRTSQLSTSPSRADRIITQPIRTSEIHSDPDIEPATTTVQRAGTMEDEPVRQMGLSEEPMQTIVPGQLTTAGRGVEVLGEDCEPIAGRARSPTTTGTRLVRVQTILSNAPHLNPTLFPALDTEMVNGASQYLREPRLWEIRTFGEDSMNSAGAGAGFGTWGAIGFPIPRVAQDCAAARAYSGRSYLHARVRWEAPGTSGTFDMDLGGPPIELYANHVKVNIIAPTNHVEIFEGVGAPAFAGPWTLQCLTDAHLGIVPIESSRGNRTTTLTMRQEAAANTQIGWEIPAYAKRVTIYQAGAGAACTQWTFEIGAFGVANASIELGQLPFIAGARRTDQIDVVPGATYIMSDVDVQNARLFTAVWEIEP